MEERLEGIQFEGEVEGGEDGEEGGNETGKGGERNMMKKVSTYQPIGKLTRKWCRGKNAYEFDYGDARLLRKCGACWGKSG